MLVLNFATLSQQVFRETIHPHLKLLQDVQNPITVTGALPTVRFVREDFYVLQVENSVSITVVLKEAIAMKEFSISASLERLA